MPVFPLHPYATSVFVPVASVSVALACSHPDALKENVNALDRVPLKYTESEANTELQDVTVAVHVVDVVSIVPEPGVENHVIVGGGL
ncbi:MAG TPA: hypothetical protein VNW46_14650 [Gemmatimonadaceae bacterium]|nr:hypothetical protein [Gemmatimonadaceae bacterium]